MTPGVAQGAGDVSGGLVWPASYPAKCSAAPLQQYGFAQPLLLCDALRLFCGGVGWGDVAGRVRGVMVHCVVSDLSRQVRSANDTPSRLIDVLAGLIMAGKSVKVRRLLLCFVIRRDGWALLFFR